VSDLVFFYFIGAFSGRLAHLGSPGRFPEAAPRLDAGADANAGAAAGTVDGGGERGGDWGRKGGLTRALSQGA